MEKKIGQALKRSIEMDSLMTPGMPGYKMPKKSLYDRLFKKKRATLDPLELDKEDFLEANAATNLENYAINDSFEDMRDASSVSNDQLLQEAQNLPKPPPMPEMYKGYPISLPKEDPNFAFIGNRDAVTSDWYPRGEPLESFANQLGSTTLNSINNGIVTNPGDKFPVTEFPQDISSALHNIQTPEISSLSDSELRGALNKYNLPTFGERKDLFKRVVDARENPALMQEAADIQSLSAQEKTKHFLGKSAELRTLNRGQQSPEQYPDNWNPQANTSANRAWGAQNLANREAELAQSGSNISGLGQAGIGVQAAENTLPQAAAQAGGVSSFASRALPIISLGLFASSLYSNAKANRDNERQKKMIEGNRI